MASINPLSSASLPQVASPLTGTNTALPTSQAALPMTAPLASPYDGTTPTPTMTGLTGNTGIAGGLGGYGGYGATTPSGSSPQLNATNQTAIAPNGNVNQQVTNENTNKYYNVIVPNSVLGGWGGLGGLFGGQQNGNSFVDPATGVLYVQRDTGVTGWFKRLFRGY